MLTWLSTNLINIVLLAVIRGMIRDRKAGKSSCGGSCADCGVCEKGCAPSDRAGTVPRGVSR